MRKPASYTILFLILFSMVMMQKYILLPDQRSTSISRVSEWLRQYPDFAEMLANPEIHDPDEYDFTYDNNSAQLVIGLNPNHPRDYAEIEKIAYQEKGEIVNTVSITDRICSITVNVPRQNIPSFLEYVTLNTRARYVEPNWKLHIDAATDDPKWRSQWGPKKIEAHLAWGTQRGEKTVLVAIIDTGIDYNHEDLAQNYLSLGYDWVNDDSHPMDDHGHGTHCAGIIAAVINNSIGVSGIAQVNLMTEKGFTSNGKGYEDDLANAIIHATDQGADVISCSWGGSTDSQLIHDAVEYATNSGTLVIAAAGNTGTNERIYPAAYPEVVAVTATNRGDRPASFTTYGDWVDLAAPGTSIYSTYLWDSYRFLSGTSMACPHVAGVAALVWSQYPTMNNEQVRSQLRYTADDLGATGFDVYYGYGRVNARKAVAETVSLAGSKVIDAPENSVYFLHIDPSNGATAQTSYDTIASGIIYGLTQNPQQQSFSSNNQILLESGEVNTSIVANATVVLLGGPCPQKTVEYYESAGFTPLRFVANATHYMFITQTNCTVAALNKTTADSGHEDLFVIEVFMDEANLILVMYGFTWKGTWASGIYFKEVISKSLNSYSENCCYILHWRDDTAQDGIPQTGEIAQEYPTH